MARSFAARPFAWTLSLFAAATLSGCGKSEPAANQFKPVDGSGATTAAIDGQEQSDAGGPSKPAPKSVAALDLESMPTDGPPAEMLAYMGMLERYQPRGVTLDERRADLMRVSRLIADAATGVLDNAMATKEQRSEAAMRKMGAINTMARHQEPKAEQELAAFCKRLLQDRDPEIAQLGRVMMFNTQAAKFEAGQFKVDKAADAEKLLADLTALLAYPDEEHVAFVLGKQAANVLIAQEEHKIAQEVIRLLGERYAKDKDKLIAGEAQELIRQADLLALGYAERVRGVLADQPKAGAGEALYAVTTKFINNMPGGMELGIASQTCEILERGEQYDVASKMLDYVEAVFVPSMEKDITGPAKEMVQRGRQRLSLLGAQLDITGLTLDGKQFDASQLKGKIVLVDFWATYCGICLEEMPNIQKYYQMYRDKGFEVIGYSVDTNKDNLSQFFANQSLPWPILTSEDPAKSGANSPLAALCGVKVLPLTVLLDGEGKVIAMHVNGDKLGRKLEELLGPVEQPPAKVSQRPMP